MKKIKYFKHKNEDGIRIVRKYFSRSTSIFWLFMTAETKKGKKFFTSVGEFYY